MEVQLMIKAPNQNIEDYSVSCSLDWTVGNLKSHLANTYPSRPVVEDQKLIYFGRLLHDHLQLKSVLRLEDDESMVYTLHLVCKGQSSASPTPQSSQSSQPLSNPEIPNQQNHPSNASESNLRQRNTPGTSDIYPQFQPAMAHPATMPVFIGDAQMLAQMAALQQMYAYYFSQYVQSMSTAAVTGSSDAVMPEIQQQTNQNEAVQRPANQRYNAANGQILLDENEEVGNRDWLDHILLSCRFMVFFVIVYFYSTPERLMIVMICAVMAFLYHEGWFVRRPQLTNEAQPENRENLPENENQAAGGNEEPQDGRELAAAMDGEDPPHVPPHRRGNNNQIISPLSLFSSFFSSLIPDLPQHINLN